MATRTDAAVESAAPPRTLRQLGYGVAAGVNAALLYLINGAPGWQALGFVTDDVQSVLGIVNASLLAGLVINLVWSLADPAWWRALGQVVLSSISLAATLQVLDVFPFDFTGWAFDPTWLVRLVLVVAAFGTGIALLVQVVTLVRLAVTGGRSA